MSLFEGKKTNDTILGIENGTANDMMFDSVPRLLLSVLISSLSGSNILWHKGHGHCTERKARAGFIGPRDSRAVPRAQIYQHDPTSSISRHLERLFHLKEALFLKGRYRSMFGLAPNS